MDMEMHAAPAPGRRLSDQIGEAFDLACAEGHLALATALLRDFEQALAGPKLPWQRRRPYAPLLEEKRATLRRLMQEAEMRRFRLGGAPAQLVPGLDVLDPDLCSGDIRVDAQGCVVLGWGADVVMSGAGPVGERSNW